MAAIHMSALRTATCSSDASRLPATTAWMQPINVLATTRSRPWVSPMPPRSAATMTARAGPDDDEQVDGAVERGCDLVDELAPHRPSLARSSNRSATLPSARMQSATRRSPRTSTSMKCRMEWALTVKELVPTAVVLQPPPLTM